MGIERYVTGGGQVVTISRSDSADYTDAQIDDLDLDALAAAADHDLAMVDGEAARFNMVHAPAGSPAGGQFAASGGQGGQGPAGHSHGRHAAEAERLHKQAASLRHQADLLVQSLKRMVAQLHQQAHAAKAAKAAATAATAGAKKASYHARHPNAAQHHRRAATRRRAARHHTRSAVGLSRRISVVRTKIKQLRTEAAQLDKRANAL